MIRVPMSSPDLEPADLEAVVGVLQTPFLSIGPQIRAFEELLARFVGIRHAVGLNSGTAGLHLCVIAAGVEAGDLVLTTPFSFIASANCILYERAIPVFVDVDPTTGNIDPAMTTQAIADLMAGGRRARRWLPPSLRDRRPAGRLKAVLPVHAFGQPADMDPIVSAARDFGLIVIEDACEAIGAVYRGKMAGTLGDAAVFAFYPNKQMTTGEGGAIVTERDDWDALFRSLRNQGRDIFDAWLNHTRLGYNYRLDEMSAALGVSQLRRLDVLLAKREQVALWYQTRLNKLAGVQPPQLVSSTTRMSWFVYVVRVLPPYDRNLVMAHLEVAGVPSRPYFTPIHLQPFYAKTFGYQRGDYPVTDMLGDTCLALPFSSVMTEAQVDLVCAALAEALNASQKG